MGIVASLLPVKIHARVGGINRRRVLFTLALKALQAGQASTNARLP